jgi:hypothetical protein
MAFLPFGIMNAYYFFPQVVQFHGYLSWMKDFSKLFTNSSLKGHVSLLEIQ